MNEEIKDASVDSPELEVLLRRVREAKSWDFDDRKAALIAHINAWADERCNQLAASRAMLPVTDSVRQVMRDAVTDAASEWSQYVEVDTAPLTCSEHIGQAFDRAIAAMPALTLSEECARLMSFYCTDTVEGLVRSMQLHIKGLQIAQAATLAPVSGGWAPMDAAPLDGTEILIRYPLQGNVKALASFNTLHKHWSSKGKVIFPVEQECEWTYLPSESAPSVAGWVSVEKPVHTIRGHVTDIGQLDDLHGAHGVVIEREGQCSVTVKMGVEDVRALASLAFDDIVVSFAPAPVTPKQEQS